MNVTPLLTGTLSIHGGHVPPPVTRIEPGDTLVVSAPGEMTRKQHAEIGGRLKELFPGHRVITFSDGLNIRVIHPADLPDEPAYQDPCPGHPEIALDFDKPAYQPPTHYKIDGKTIPVGEYETMRLFQREQTEAASSTDH